MSLNLNLQVRSSTTNRIMMLELGPFRAKLVQAPADFWRPPARDKLVYPAKTHRNHDKHPETSARQPSDWSS